MLLWEDAIKKYPDKWVVFRDPKYLDEFHMKLYGGEFVGVGDTQSKMLGLIPDEDDGSIYTARHTAEYD